jgi:dienelactone hydrolase
MKALAWIAVLALGAPEPRVELVTKEIEYRHGDVVLEGYAAWPKDAKGRLPGVLVCHQWMGPTPYERYRVEETAKLGTVAFALDIYGKGVRPKDAPEAAKTATAY